jgi:hypothetical protein
MVGGVANAHYAFFSQDRLPRTVSKKQKAGRRNAGSLNKN